MPKGVPLTSEEISRRRHEIYDKTVHLIVEKGFRETSMREIAEVAGMGKSSLYDYFKTKDEILVWAVEDEVSDLTLVAKKIAAQHLPVIQRLQQILQTQLEYLLQRKEFFLKLSFEVQRLSMESQQRIQIKRHAYQDLIRQLIDEGIRDGTFRPVDSLLVMRTLFAAITPTVFTSRPSGTPEEMLITAFDIILKGIQA